MTVVSREDWSALLSAAMTSLLPPLALRFLHSVSPGAGGRESKA